MTGDENRLEQSREYLRALYSYASTGTMLDIDELSKSHHKVKKCSYCGVTQVVSESGKCRMCGAAL